MWREANLEFPAIPLPYRTKNKAAYHRRSSFHHKKDPMSNKIFVLCLPLMIFSLVACETAPKPYKRKAAPPVRLLESKTLTAKKTVATPPKKRFIQEGVASWYGPNFHKKKTANGETYDMYGMTAAHNTIPFDIYVKVTNLENWKSTVVRINDRGPFAKNRIIDLTHTAASKLSMLKNGTAAVRIEALGFKKEMNGKQVFIAPSSYSIKGTYTLQVGSFKTRGSAESLAKSIEPDFSNVHITDVEVGGEKYYRVLAGSYKTKEDAESDKERLIKAGYTGAHLLTE